MTYIKHNGEWKRTTNAEIGTIREVETFMVPDNPSVIQGVTRTLSGEAYLNNEASNATLYPKFFNFGVYAVPYTAPWGYVELDFTEYRPTKVSIGVWFKDGSHSNGCAFQIKHMNWDGSVVEDYYASYSGQPNIQQYKSFIFDHPKIVYIGLGPNSSNRSTCDITHVTVMK